MLLLLLTALCFGTVKGFFSPSTEEVCYGAKFVMPFRLLPSAQEKIFFSPRDGGEMKLIINNTMVDPRYKVTGNTVTVPDVTERDEGTFLANAYGSVIYSSVTLKVKDCSDKEFKKYGQLFTHRISNRAEYIEFTPIHSLDKPVVLWNRTDPHINRGRRGIMQDNVWEMKKLTQADNGYYNVRKRDRSLIRRWKLTVEEYTEYYDKMANERLLITFALDPDVCTVTFQSEKSADPIVLMKSGALVQDYSLYPSQFSERIRKLESIAPTLGFEIEDLQTADSGIYEIRDQAGNLALVVHVTVLEEASTFVYIGIAVGIILGLIFCCCCVKRCCCGKSSSKGGDAVPQTADEPALDHDTSQPAITSYSSSPHVPRYTYYPMNPINSPVPTSSSINPPDTQTAVTSYLASPQVPYYTYNPTNPINPSETTSTSINPSTLSPADIRVSSQQPEVAPPGGQRAAPTVTFGSDNLSSTAEHRFELKGLPFPCAPPLSSDSTLLNVYNSDKLNFR